MKNVRQIRPRTILLSGAVFAAAFGLGATSTFAASGDSEVHNPGSGRGGAFQPSEAHGYEGQLKSGPHRPAIGGVPADVNGDGVISDTGDETYPNLVRAYGDDGEIGYLHIEDMVPPTPKDPEDLRRQEEAYNNGARLRAPLYAEDGVTRIGWYTYHGSVAP